MRLRWVAACAAVAVLAVTGAGTAGAQSSSGSAPKEALTASEVGITPTEVRIGVIADTGSSLAPGLFQGSVDAVQAWAKYMNEKEGGLAGRKIVVDTYDSGLDANKARNAIIEACAKDFAIIGTSAIFVFNTDDLTGCKDAKGAATGLPDFPVVTTEVAHQCSPVSFPINPPVLDCATKDQEPQTYRGGLGATRYYLKKFGKNALHGLYLYPSDLKASKNSNQPGFEARQDAGIEQDATFDVSARAAQSDFTPFVQTLKDNGSTYAIQGAAAGTMIALMKEAKLQGVNTVKVWDCSLQCYDAEVLATPETEGLYVWTQFLPFGETNSNKMLRNFVKYTGRDKADGFGAQAWASGLMLRDAVNTVTAGGGSNAVTRAATVQAMEGMKQFDADGMIGTLNPGDRAPSSCFALSQVKRAEFVRIFPKKAGTFDCGPENEYTIKLDLG